VATAAKQTTAMAARRKCAWGLEGEVCTSGLGVGGVRDWMTVDSSLAAASTWAMNRTRRSGLFR